MSATTALSAPARTTTTSSSELRELAALAGPLTLSYVGGTLMGFVDTAMVGRLGATALAAVGIGNGIYFLVSMAGMGLVLGMDPLTAQAIGAGERDRARRVLWQAVRLVGLVGIEAETAGLVWSYLLGRFLNAIPFLIWIACRSFLQANGRARPVVTATIWANVANAVGNLLFIYGDEGLVRIGLPRVGLPSLGVFGSGVASTIASTAMLFVAYRELKRLDALPGPEDRRIDPATLRAITRVGAPIAVQVLAEGGSFSLVGVLAGRLGAMSAAAHQVAINLASMSFTMALGLSTATSVRVGHAVGRGDSAAARRSGIVGLVASSGVMSVSAALFALAPAACARILSDKPELIAAAVPLIRIAAVFQLAVGAQAVAAGALRGAGETRSAQVANVIGYYVLGMPIAFGLCFGLGVGAPGLWWGLTTGLFVAAVALIVRFLRMSAGEIRRL
jgi:MATE family multidrug resistance protein